MNSINIKFRFLSAVTAVLALTGCNDGWDDHYGAQPKGEFTGVSVYEVIETNPELSTFKEMIDIAGYSELLS
ncbi:MAG: hypothetical protein K2M98_00595 [Muribaculum sp.]|nr:hypothetical protein [Muribaculum sp.]